MAPFVILSDFTQGGRDAITINHILHEDANHICSYASCEDVYTRCFKVACQQYRMEWWKCTDKEAYNDTLMKQGDMFKKNSKVFASYKIDKGNKLTEESLRMEIDLKKMKGVGSVIRLPGVVRISFS
ncbi:hypothetical protein GIB67_022289 [Kingdonia uniflora]|uniref:Uncharacterized protein n=1 Tax=Kingdonia uniflora TaxID=39325 RepID=A0A7J7KVZ7_9MAGN|nr:hypothetical protein GIB67_022289 [Kingdonia uniflora]